MVPYHYLVSRALSPFLMLPVPYLEDMCTFFIPSQSRVRHFVSVFLRL